MQFSGRAILLDIEGTTSSVSFVYDVMFPFVRRELAAFLSKHWDDADVQRAAAAIAQDAGAASLDEWTGDDDPTRLREQVAAEVTRLMDGDVKATGLKQLQGLIWRSGFESGEMQAHVYDDVPPALRRWKTGGIDVRIYSSGSIQAQKLFFGHTVAGNLLDLLNGHYDTTTGPKMRADSYRAIGDAFAVDANEILFLSDIPAELDAAATAGMQTGLVSRPGNAPVDDSNHARLTSFDEIEMGAA
ncbi:MAG: acireductone synthase [Pirellulaceae bacterium]|jgi:enolase-phosphatase E1|nr:acireductone synthase [Pirellulaceae bacterium]MDP7015984.1 acireductone synthase [Pirellulaceae bacterium]